MRFVWVGADGFYGNDLAFLRGVDAMGEVFAADVHCDQRIFLEDPQPTVKNKKGKRGRRPTKLEANAPAIRVDRWQSDQPDEAWKRVKVGDSSRGELQVDVVHRRLWLWDNEKTDAHCWHLIVRREVNPRGLLGPSVASDPARRRSENRALWQLLSDEWQNLKDRGAIDREVRERLEGLAAMHSAAISRNLLHSIIGQRKSGELLAFAITGSLHRIAMQLSGLWGLRDAVLLDNGGSVGWRSLLKDRSDATTLVSGPNYRPRGTVFLDLWPDGFLQPREHAALLTGASD